MRRRNPLPTLSGILALALASPLMAAGGDGPSVQAILGQLESPRGIAALVGDREARLAVELARASELLVYVQFDGPEQLAAARRALDDAGLLNRRVYVEHGPDAHIGLADNLADVAVACNADLSRAGQSELLRVVRPGGKAWLAGKMLTKPQPEGVDDWSHPYHGPDNNPQSKDRLARAPYLTQFIAEPKFCPSPAITVASGGRIFRACGHQAHKANQNAMLNTLLAVNAYNGTILWKRPLREGFMVLRNTMIATPDTLYLADDQSCQLLDTAAGRLRGEIRSPDPEADGSVWKWMALEKGVLLALLGGPEFKAPLSPSDEFGVGGWPRTNWPGFDYQDPKTAWAQGRTLVAFDVKTRKLLWRHRAPDLVDGRAVCMSDGRLYFLSPERFLACLRVADGDLLWKTSDADLLQAIGPLFPQKPRWTGLSPFPYVRCDEKCLFFSGPRMPRVVAVSTRDGKLLWQKEVSLADGGSVHLLLRDKGLYAVGEPRGDGGFRMDYQTGKALTSFLGRRGCTLATGSVDGIFYRAAEGTVRVDLATGREEHIAPMRPPCYEGVIIAGGLLHWGAWKCRCPLSLYGNIGLAAAGAFNFRPGADGSRLHSGLGDLNSVAELDLAPGDWPCYQGNNERTMTTRVSAPRQVHRRWTYQPPIGAMPTAPVAAGNMLFVADQQGLLRALEASGGKLLWKAYTGGAVFFPPAIWKNRLYAGSADGQVYAFEAKTGRPLWQFRAAPAQRRIPVFGKLISTWPVAGGVVVEDGTLYTAAGIAHYDGTHVYALDALSGKLKWYNDTSGTLSPQTGSGVSLQGELYLEAGELRFAGGNVCSAAAYDLATGRCTSTPAPGVVAMARTAFYPYYPEHGQFVSLNHTLGDGQTLSYTADYGGVVHSTLALLGPLPPGGHRLPPDWRVLPQRAVPGVKPPIVWQHKPGDKYNGFVVAPEVLLTAGRAADGQGAFLAAVNIADGAEIWRHSLPAPVVKGGLVMDHRARIFASLEDGHVLCFGAEAIRQ